MSKPTISSPVDAGFSMLLDASKAPGFNFEALMAVQRKNVEAMTAINQVIFEGIQSIIQRQTELVRQGFEEGTNLANAIMSCPSPEEKVIRQAEASKAAVEKYLANAHDITETIAKCNNQAMETVSNRLSEGLQEFRDIIKSDRAAA